MSSLRRSALQLLTFVALSGGGLAGSSASPPSSAKVESLLYLRSTDAPPPAAPSAPSSDIISHHACNGESAVSDTAPSFCGSDVDDAAAAASAGSAAAAAGSAAAGSAAVGSAAAGSAAAGGHARQHRGGGFVAPRPHVLPPDRVIAAPHQARDGAPQPRDVVQEGEPQSTYETRLQANLAQDDDDDAIEGRAVGASSSKSIVALTALGSYAAVTLAAKFGLLPGPLGLDGSAYLPYADSLILRDLGSSLLCAALGLGFVKTVSSLAASDVLESRDSRKIIHTLSAPLFMTLWPLFSDAVGARYFAGIVPLTNAVRLYVAGTGSGDKELASAVSRSGDAKEAIGGPFFYVLVLLAATVGSWRDDLVGIVAVSTMAAGDGLADLIGRRYGKTNKWFFNKDKSIAGSSAFFVGASLSSVALAWWLGQSGALTLPLEFADLSTRIVLISAICAMVELLPVVDDNWSVPLSAAVLSAYLLHH